VAAPYAGTVLSITNTCGISMGIIGNILTGLVVDRTGRRAATAKGAPPAAAAAAATELRRAPPRSFAPIFVACGLLYMSSLFVWLRFVRPIPLLRRAHIDGTARGAKRAAVLARALANRQRRRRRRALAREQRRSKELPAAAAK
jgi:hypothetical protein